MATGTATIETLAPPPKPTREEILQAEVDALDAKVVADILRLDSEADGLVGEADAYRAQAAGKIVKLLDAGGTERAVAKAINKSNAHVHFAAAAWRAMQDPAANFGQFQDAYKAVKNPPRVPDETAQGNSGSSDADSDEAPFPAWKKQMAAARNLLGDMVEQASLPQIRQLLTLMDKTRKAAAEKEQELDSV
jgi:hypothetical protein